VFADLHGNPLKLDRIRRLGARVIQAGDDFDAAREAAEAYARDTPAELLVDGEDPSVAAGAGTLALEVTDGVDRGELPAPATAYVPVGNGALIVGVGAWLRHALPGCRIVGVQSDAAPSMTLSFQAGRPIATDRADTFAEGIATRVPVPEALDAMVGRVDDMILVSEAALRDAQRVLSGALGLTVEGGAAASWAGLVADQAAGRAAAGPALIIVTGTNVAPPAEPA
jgi:threonine dehydratase